MDPPKTHKVIMIAGPTPSFLERGDLTLDRDLENFKKLRIHNNLWRRNTIFIEIYRGKSQDKFLILEYAPARKGGDPDKLLVPEAIEKKISPYLGLKNPKISRLGTPLWFETKRKAKEDIIKFAQELLILYKTRSEVRRPPYEPSHFEKSVWNNFEFEETPSQKSAIEDIFLDMAKAEPMERLVVGDVGFGKTEVALRAALRAVLNGKQVALLSPTTVLADQHSQTFKKKIEEAFSEELKRGGQVYFPSPRIMKMPFIMKKLDKQFPKIKKEILHGKVGEKHLVRTMREFREGKIKILVSTTIIENGLDISSVNTLIVED